MHRGSSGSTSGEAQVEACSIQRVPRNRNVRVRDHSSPEEASRAAQHFLALDRQLLSLLAAAGGAAAAALAEERESFLAESMGRKQPVLGSPAELGRAWPSYWCVLNWTANWDGDRTSGVLFSLASSPPRPGAERGIHDAASALFLADIIGPAVERDIGLRTEVMRTVLAEGGLEGKKAVIKYLQPASCKDYSACVAGAILFAFRYCTRASAERAAAHGGAAGSHVASPVEVAVQHLSGLTAAFSKAPDEQEQHQAKKQKQQQQQPPAASPELSAAILELFQALLDERVPSEGHGCGSCTACSAGAESTPTAAGSPPAAPSSQQRPAASVLDAAMRLPLLVAYVRASMVSCTSGQYSFRRPAFCRATTVPLLYAAKAFVLYRLAHRKQGAPVDRAAVQPLAQDSAAQELLLLLRNSDTPFQRLVAVAAEARRQANGEQKEPMEFTRQERMFAHHVEGKWIAEEAPYLAAVRSLEKASEALDAVLSTDGSGGSSPLEQPRARDPDGTGRHEALLFGDSNAITAETTEHLASLLFDRHGGGTASKALAEDLRRAVTCLALAVNFDLGIGSRISELTDLLAVPFGTGLLSRSISLAEGDGLGQEKVVRLHVSSHKNSRSDLAFLSERLSALVVVYLAKVGRGPGRGGDDRCRPLQTHTSSRVLPGPPLCSQGAVPGGRRSQDVSGLGRTQPLCPLPGPAGGQTSRGDHGSLLRD
jgi:hypothetical protein